MGPFVVGFLCAMVIIFLCAWASFRFGHPPVAVADPPFPFEAQIVRAPLGARIQSELQKAPFGTSEDQFEAGAKIYSASCANCHGTPKRSVRFARYMYPQPTQLFRKHNDSAVVGVSDDEAGVTFWKIKNGIRLTGMPAYKRIYSDTEMWDVALLLKNADQPLPDPVTKLLEQETPAPAAAMVPLSPK